MKAKEVEGGIKDEVKESQEEPLGKKKKSIGSGNRGPRRKKIEDKRNRRKTKTDLTGKDGV